jgi:hypothetical protein
MAEEKLVEPDEENAAADEEAQRDDSRNGYEEELAAYEQELARYLQERIKPGLSRSTIPLVARSIARDIARKEPPEPPEGENVPEGGDDGAPDFEADMRDLQAELGEDWILRFSVQGERAWLTAEKEDASQRVDAPNASGLIRIVEAINEGGGRGA